MPDAAPPPLVVIGGSAGAIGPLRQIVADLPVDFPAAVCVAIHLPRDSPSTLPVVLSHAGPLGAAFGVDGARLEPAFIHVAPPGNHLLIHDGHLALSVGATENGARPAIDPLFRTAARSAGRRLVGVILSGALDDGSAGIAAVSRAGGLAIVQEPDDAEFSDMPRNALDTGVAAGVLSATAIGPALIAAVDAIMARKGNVDVAAGSAAAELPDVTRAAAGVSETSSVDRGLGGPAPDLPGMASPYSCPACGGVLYDRPDEQYLCRLGHRYSPVSLAADQRVVVEDALWVALRALEEAASLQARVRDRAGSRGDAPMERRFEERRKAARVRADRIRNVLKTFATEEAGAEASEA